ncbi:hypothetical protein MSAN_01643300 [Mycena sanguinolenta]|uniref:Uncharacterized protein n=1 Tax=Mycena sanguinolenta TaxID=230812 RepID=A0A8H7CWQ2_9AGAR|nr:hypothetical protein MSAN_01643300 [Mycena sanguinolenta]
MLMLSEPSSFIADGLVIYRCYVVWNNNVFVTILPILMLIATTGLVVSFDFTLTLYPFFALSLATNVLVTALTGIRAYLVDLSLFSRVFEDRRTTTIHIRHCHHVVESGALYSATVLAFLIMLSIPSVVIVSNPIYQMQAQVMGIAPTLIIVRAGLAVKGEEVKLVDDSMASRERRIFGIPVGQLDPGKDVPAIATDVEKGLSNYHTWEN